MTLQDDGGSDRSIMLDDGWVHFAYLGNDIYGGLSETLHRRIEETGGYGLPYTYTYDLEPGKARSVIRYSYGDLSLYCNT